MAGSTWMRLGVGAVTLAVVGQVAVTAAPPPANAAQPGNPGLIAWQRTDGDGDHILTMRPDGSDRQPVVDGATPAWTPDGASIVFVGSGGITRVDATGSGAQVLLDHGANPAVSPDGTRIAFDHDDGGSGHRDVFVMDADGSDVTRLTTDPGADSDPAWSPDGTRIAFTSDRRGFGEEPWLMAAGGSGQALLRVGWAGSQIDWSPRAGHVALRHPTSGIALLAVDGPDVAWLTGEASAGSPAWSPDGTRVVFSSAQDGNDELYLVRADGTGGLLRLTDDSAGGTPYAQDAHPAWQPLALAATPSSPSFTGVVGTATAATPVEMTPGPRQVTISSVGVAGTNAADFLLASNTCTGTIAADATCTVGVQFKPTAGGPRNAILRFTGPAPVGTFDVPLTGAARAFAWGTLRAAGPAYTWSYGNALAQTVSGSTTYLHTAYTTDRIGSSWAKDGGPKVGVYYVRSSNGGAKWTTAKRLNPTSQHGSRSAIAASGSSVYVAWVSTTKWYAYSATAPRVLYIRRNTSNGSATRWKATVRLTSTSGRVDFPSIAASGAYVYVAYTDAVTGSVKLAISKDRGATWRTKSIGSTTMSGKSGKSGWPSVAASGSAVAVSWVASPTGDVKARIGSSYGASWLPVAAIGVTQGWTPSTAALGGRVAVAWTTPDGVRLRVASSGAWGPDLSVARDDLDTSMHQGAAVALYGSSSVAVAYSACHSDCTWSDAGVVSYADLNWRQSADNGATWMPASVIGPSSSSSRRSNDTPSILWRTAARPYVLWNGWTEGTSNYRLYVRGGR